MPGFSITPVTGYPPIADEGFPRFLQWQSDGTDVGNRSVETVNFVGAAEVTVSADGSTVTVDLGNTPRADFWREVPGDTTLILADANSGLRCTGTTGTQTIVIPGGDVAFDPGVGIVVFGFGSAGVQFTTVSGVSLLYRDTFLAELAGQYATVTLIKTAEDEWTICGDLASVP